MEKRDTKEMIHIKHVGPLTDTGEIQLNRVMLLIGPQGAGKSTFMKVLCFCRWVEKRIMRYEKEFDHYLVGSNFIDRLKLFFHLNDDFFGADSLIIYKGSYATISWGEDGEQSIRITPNPENESRLYNSKLSFIPSERNLASAHKKINEAYMGNPHEDMLFNFLLELRKASETYRESNKLKLSIGEDFSYFSNHLGDHFIEQRSINKSFLSYYTASGLQSVFPIDVIGAYLMGELNSSPELSLDELFTLVNRDKKVQSIEEGIDEILNKRFEELRYKSIHLFIEEPELNLYPEAQKELLLNLLNIITKAKDKEKHPSSLVMTTHSPYLLSVMNVQIAKAWAEEEKKCAAESEEETRGEKQNGHLSSYEFSAYYISKEGTLKDLIASDKNQDGDPIEFPMIDGTDLDSVSTWVNNELNDVYTEYYDED